MAERKRKEVGYPRLDIIIIELEIMVDDFCMQYKTALTREQMLEVIARNVEVRRIPC